MTTVTAELNPLRAVVSGVAIPVGTTSGQPHRPDVPLGWHWPSGVQNGTAEMPSVDGDTLWGAFLSPHEMPVSEIGMVVTSAASAGAWRIGLWYPNPDAKHLPGALLLDAGEIDPTTTGIKSVAVAVPVTIPKGFVFVSVTAVGAAGLAGEAATADPVLLSFQTIPSELGATACYFSEEVDSGALPSTAPALSLAAYAMGVPFLILQHGAVVGG